MVFETLLFMGFDRASCSPTSKGCVRSGIHSAIHSKIRRGNVRRVRTSDECHHRGDIVSLSIALERGRGLLWYRPITRGGVQIRFDGAGLHVIDSNAPAPDLSG